MVEVGTASSVRTARAEDVDAVVRLLRGIYAEERYFVGDGAPRADALARHLSGDDPAYAAYLVAERDGEVAGWLELHRPQAVRLRHVVMITLAVAAGHRRRGIGRSLLRAGYDWARAHGVLKVGLHVRAENEPAIRLYRSEGFELEGREVRQIRDGDHFEDNLLMARFL